MLRRPRPQPGAWHWPVGLTSWTSFVLLITVLICIKGGLFAGYLMGLTPCKTLTPGKAALSSWSSLQMISNGYYCGSVAQSHPTVCDPMDCNMPGFPVLHYFLEFAYTQVHWVSDAIQWSYPLLPPSPPSLNLSQHKDLFQWVGSLHQVAKVLELQLQHQCFQWIFRTDFL